MNKANEIYVWVSCWEWELGESFLTYFSSNIDTNKFVDWLARNSYMNKEQHAEYSKELIKAETFWDKPTFIEVLVGGYEYSIMNRETEDKERDINYKCLQIVSDYLSESEKGIEDVYNFMFIDTEWCDKDEIEIIKNTIKTYKNTDIPDYDKVKTTQISDLQ